MRRRGVALDEAVEVLADWAVGIYRQREERMLDAAAGFGEGEYDHSEEERVARMNNQVLDAMGMEL